MDKIWKIMSALAILPALTFCKGKDDTTAEKPAEEVSYPASLPASDKIPVMAFHGVNREYMSEARFQEAAELGVTLNYSRSMSLDESLKMLDFAKSSGIKCFIEIGNDRYGSARRAEVVAALKSHPALAGYFCADEPTADQFSEVKTVMDEVRAVDTSHPCYCNLFPSSIMTSSEYVSYVDKYLSTLPVEFLSFDQYPVYTNGSSVAVQPTWYNSLEIARKEAKAHKVPLWAFMLTVRHAVYPMPTIEHLRLQGYSDLAYGAQTIELFTYWSPSAESSAYHEAPINGDGSKSAVYYTVQKYLVEMQKLAYVFYGAEVEGVWHISNGGSIPDGTTIMAAKPECFSSLSISSGSQALVSVLSNHGYKFAVLQNTSPSADLTASIALKANARKVEKDGSIVTAASTATSFKVGAGDILVFMWKPGSL